jgi:hypothetical protein
VHVSQGDTVNTASRMCSFSEPWHIQLHPSTVCALQQVLSLEQVDSTPAAHFIMTPRAPTWFKSKGIISATWLSTLELNSLASAFVNSLPQSDSAMSADLTPPSRASGSLSMKPLSLATMPPASLSLTPPVIRDRSAAIVGFGPPAVHIATHTAVTRSSLMSSLLHATVGVARVSLSFEDTESEETFVNSVAFSAYVGLCVIILTSTLFVGAQLAVRPIDLPGMHFIVIVVTVVLLLLLLVVAAVFLVAPIRSQIIWQRSLPMRVRQLEPFELISCASCVVLSAFFAAAFTPYNRGEAGLLVSL